jgi:hypothetical protein
METITIPKETFEKILDALKKSATHAALGNYNSSQWVARLAREAIEAAQKAEQESALQRVADLGQEIEAGPVSMQPLADKEISVLFEAINKDPGFSMFSAENWFTCGITTAEAFHGIKAKP